MILSSGENWQEIMAIISRKSSLWATLPDSARIFLN